MAIICRKYNLLFIMTPRTACTAIGELLCEYYGGEFLPGEDILDSHGFISVQKKHSTLAELLEHKLLTADEANSLLKVAAVRNPYDSLVSLYLKQRYKYQPLLSDPASWVNRLPGYANDMNYCQRHSFNEWSFRVSYRKIVKRLLGLRPSMYADHTRGMDVILRYEKIENGLQDVFHKAGIAWKADIPKLNRTDERSDRDYRSFYSWPAMLAVGFAYSYDLKAYGYKFQSSASSETLNRASTRSQR
jgi:Sulfotransferase family